MTGCHQWGSCRSSREVQARGEALLKAIGDKLTNSTAEQMLIAAGLRPVPSPGCANDREALCAYQDALSNADEATLQRLESAVTQVIFTQPQPPK